MISNILTSVIAALTLSSHPVLQQPIEFSKLPPLTRVELPQPITQCIKDCKVNDDLVQFVSKFEGYSPFTYRDSAGNPTIGIGHLIQAGDHFKEPLLPPEATKLLEGDLLPKALAVDNLTKRPLYQRQFNALVSFTYNVGTGNLKKSTLLKKVNQPDDAAVPAQFLKWTDAGGQQSSGLVIRRKAEAALYQSATEAKLPRKRTTSLVSPDPNDLQTGD